MQNINRRDFLGRSALATLAMGAVGFPFIRVARADEPGPNDKIRLGIIGCGDQGLVDLKNFFLNPEVDCVVACDVDEARLARVQGVCQTLRGKSRTR